MDCEKIKKILLNFFDNSIKIESDEKECRIAFPIYGRDNDLLELTIRKSSLPEKGKYYITDDAENISSLYLYGMNIEGDNKSKSILDSIEKTLNVKIENDELKAYANDNDLGLIISKVLSSILGIQYIQYLAKPKMITAFKQTVKIFLDEKSPDYVYNPKIKGSTGEESRFDFGYPQNKVFIDSLHATTDYWAFNRTIATCIKSVEITKITPELKVVAIYDDVDEESKNWWTSKVLHYMDTYLHYHIPWSKKEILLEIIE